MESPKDLQHASAEMSLNDLYLSTNGCHPPTPPCPSLKNSNLPCVHWNSPLSSTSLIPLFARA